MGKRKIFLSLSLSLSLSPVTVPGNSSSSDYGLGKKEEEEEGETFAAHVRGRRSYQSVKSGDSFGRDSPAQVEANSSFYLPAVEESANSSPKRPGTARCKSKRIEGRGERDGDKILPLL